MCLKYWHCSEDGVAPCRSVRARDGARPYVPVSAQPSVDAATCCQCHHLDHWPTSWIGRGRQTHSGCPRTVWSTTAGSWLGYVCVLLSCVRVSKSKKWRNVHACICGALCQRSCSPHCIRIHSLSMFKNAASSQNTTLILIHNIIIFTFNKEDRKLSISDNPLTVLLPLCVADIHHDIMY